MLQLPSVSIMSIFIYQFSESFIDLSDDFKNYCAHDAAMFATAVRGIVTLDDYSSNILYKSASLMIENSYLYDMHLVN